MNYYEMYITKMASKYGKEDKEADILLKKFQHEKFSGGIESNELYKM
jgi:fatty acid/phospholipid biosynthesis enzyme|tara:strand:- start:271 stop:411 length:141 start_codon:yes stop_codon:yes gene_type:complete